MERDTGVEPATSTLARAGTLGYFATPHPERLAPSVAGALLSLAVANAARRVLAPAGG